MNASEILPTKDHNSCVAVFSFTHLIDSQIPQSSWEMGNSKMFLFIIHGAFSFVNFFFAFLLITV